MEYGTSLDKLSHTVNAPQKAFTFGELHCYYKLGTTLAEREFTKPRGRRVWNRAWRHERVWAAPNVKAFGVWAKEADEAYSRSKNQAAKSWSLPDEKV